MRTKESPKTHLDPVETISQLVSHGFELIELRRTDSAYILELHTEQVDWLKKPMKVEVSQDGLVKSIGSPRSPADFYTWMLHEMEAAQ